MTVHPTFAGALRAGGDKAVAAIAIGASTGGPQALLDLFADAGAHLGVPVFVTQHLPVNFASVLAMRIGEAAHCECREAEDGEAARPGRIYFAPDEHHMLIEGTRERPVMRLAATAHENYCRPAIDPMFRSAAKVYGRSLLAIVLTGMGEDGLAGAREVAREGGRIVVQDEDSSVVWEMPAAVASAGLASAIMPLAHIRQGILGVAAQARV